MSRILIYSRTFLPVLGGMERNTLTLGRLFHQWGHHVTVFTETLDKDVRRFPFEVIRSRNSIKLARAILLSDLVFVNGGLAVKACLPCLLLRRPYVPIYQMANAFVQEAKSFARIALCQLLTLCAKAHATVSESDKNRFLECYPTLLCKAVPNPIDEELSKAALQISDQSGKDFDLLYAGRLIEGKGIFLLLEALNQLKTTKDLRVAFAGDGPHAERLFSEANRLGLNVTRLGRLDQDKLISAYQRSRVLVVPSTTHTEGYPLVISEAITFGLPVIASDQPALVEAVGKAGRCFRRYDGNDLALAIQWIFTDTNYRNCVEQTKVQREDVSLACYEQRMRDLFLSLGLLGGNLNQ